VSRARDDGPTRYDGFALFIDEITLDNRRVKALTIIDERGPGREAEIEAQLERFAQILREWFPLQPITVLRREEIVP
jgi:hypothetical protein